MTSAFSNDPADTKATSYRVHRAVGLDALPIRIFHAIAQLRQEVFVVEQNCAYLDLDGRDTEPTTEQLWISAEDGSVVATLRVLAEDTQEAGLKAIGRVATATTHRGNGLAALLMRAALEEHGKGPLALEAQSHLTGWYARFGFAVHGAEYLEDGIPHTPMRREPVA